MVSILCPTDQEWLEALTTYLIRYPVLFPEREQLYTYLREDALNGEFGHGTAFLEVASLDVLGELETLIEGHFSVGFLIRFNTQEDQMTGVLLRAGCDKWQPMWFNTIERLSWGKVIDNHNQSCIPEVNFTKTNISLLPSSVPHIILNFESP